jgi:TonB family protein
VVATCAGQTSVQFAAAEVDLQPGTFPGADDCLGEGQVWPTQARGIDYVPVDQLPVAMRRVEPEYSRAGEARGLRGTLVVNAIVCRTGSVLDAWVTWPEGAASNREMETLALDAVRQWSFTPASFQGSPRAIVVAIPMRFPPP